jgi:3-isopropylmalate/(R)-2-methylmalate dehydratase large subunit
MTLLEKILAAHSDRPFVIPGDIIDLGIDIRVARDFGGANVVRNIRNFSLAIDDPDRTLFTFDCNPTGSDQKYAVNQHICRVFARENGIKVYDINAGIGTHILIEEGYVYPGSTAVSTDSHANILGAVGAFGQGMGDQDIASAWHSGKVWFKVPESVRIVFNGNMPDDIDAKDVVLNLLDIFGANSLLGLSIEMYGKAVDNMTLDDRLTISSMATEMGAIIILFPPTKEIVDYCKVRSRKTFSPVFADEDAAYSEIYDIDISRFTPMLSLPGEPHNTVKAESVYGQKIDSAFIGSCTNGRMSDMLRAAAILKGRTVAPGVVLKIVPATDSVWNQCLKEGVIDVFKSAGALVSNAGCAGCAAGQVGQNGPGEITISTGNRNFVGKQGKGSVYLASPVIVAASAVAGFITTPDRIPEKPQLFEKPVKTTIPGKIGNKIATPKGRPLTIKGRVWIIDRDNIDTDMIFHNRYLAITVPEEMGRYTLDNLEGYKDFANKVKPGDIIITGKNFGCGSSRQQAVDCFLSLGIQAILAESFAAIYERNAINAAFPVLVYSEKEKAEIKTGDIIEVDFTTGLVTDLENNKSSKAHPFPEVQMEIYRRGGLLSGS